MLEQLEAFAGEYADVDAAVETLIQQIRHGNVVVLHGLKTENIQNWSKLLPQNLTLQEVNSRHAVMTSEHELLDGLSGTDLWWSRYPSWHRKEQGAVAVAYAAVGAEQAYELAAPGALLVCEMQKGLLVIDQMLWEKQEVHQNRSGQYIAILLDNLRRRDAARVRDLGS